MNWILLNLPLVALAAGLTVIPILWVTLTEDDARNDDRAVATAGSDRAHR